MSHFSIIRDASLALAELVFDALSDAPDIDFGFNANATDITLSAPADDIPDSAKLSIYLYHIAPDPQFRNQQPFAAEQDEKVGAPFALRLSYLVTPLLEKEIDNQLVLGRILQALNDTPLLLEINGAPLGDSLGSDGPELRLSIEPLPFDELAQIWHVIGSEYRLSVAYTMGIVMFGPM